MPRDVYESARNAVIATDPYSTQRYDVCGVAGATTDQKIAAALRQLAKGESADGLVEYSRLSESIVSLCHKRFCRAVMASDLKSQFLRVPTAEELKEIERQYSRLGFPGCIGCVDVASWTWDMCPIAWQGMFKGRGGKLCCRMEVVCDDFLYIWHCNFGFPGSKNDVQIMHSSPLFNAIRTGNFLLTRPDTDVAGFRLHWYYYLYDGIYPAYRIFMLIISKPRHAKEKLYEKQQEGARKAVENVFGVLFKRFAILYQPSRLWTTSAMSDIVDCCVVLHNMIVSARKRNYTGTAYLRLVEDCALPLSVSRIFQYGDRVEEHGEFWRETVANVDNRNHHHQLKAALVRYIWGKAAGNALLDSRSDCYSFATSTVGNDAGSFIQCDQNEA
jgi:hypothetical protein